MFSKDLLQMDRNTAQYMLEELKRENKELRRILEAVENKKIEEIEEKKRIKAELEREIQDMEKDDICGQKPSCINCSVASRIPHKVPLVSKVPRPQRTPSSMVPSKAGFSHSDSSTGTTS